MLRRMPAHRGGLSALATRLNALYGDAFELEYGGNGAGIWCTRVNVAGRWRFRGCQCGRCR